MSHAKHDAVSLEIARRIASSLDSHPEWIELARSNLARWSERNKDTPSLLKCYQEWSEILARPVQEIKAVLLAETDDGQRLRQNSPFPRVLTQAEVLEIKRRIHQRKF